MQVKLTMGAAAAQLDQMNPRLYIGRDPATCALVSQEPSVSRRHAEVFLQAGQTFIRDLGSSNGTWVDGQLVGGQPAPLAPGAQVYVGHAPLGVEWVGGPGAGKTQMVALPPALKAQMEARFAEAQAAHAAAAPATAPAPAPGPGAPARADGDIGVGGKEAPKAADYAYRRQGSNSNGSLLIALNGDTFANDQELDGYLEFTALDNETVASIIVDLVECHKKGPKKGHVWDRMLVRQGPWKSRKGDVLPMQFKLRVPPGTSMSGRDCHWELRGYVDINWAFDVEATSPINMRNLDLERIRDALGHLDYRIVDLNSMPLGQIHKGKFQPPAELRKQVGISNINLHIEYLGQNLKVKMEVEKTSLFRFDKREEFVFDIAKLRAAQLPEIAQHFKTHIDRLMTK